MNEAPETADDGGTPRRRPHRALEWLKSILIAAVLFLVIRGFVLQTFVIISGSMEDTLLVGDFLVANRLAVGSRIPATGLRIPGYSEARRGDVMVFDPHHMDDRKVVKRVVGRPGDTLEMRDGTLLVNGTVLSEPYVIPDTGPDERSPDFAWQAEYLVDGVDPSAYEPTRRTWGPLVVPPEHYFMLGDNRGDSYDSRYWGPLAARRLEGRVSFIYFSYDRESYRPFPALREIRWSRIGSFRSEVASVAPATHIDRGAESGVRSSVRVSGSWKQTNLRRRGEPPMNDR